MTPKRRYRDDEIFDERGLLKDGRSFRTHLTMMDAMPRGATQITDCFGNGGVALHRPGFRVLLGDNTGMHAKAEAQRQYLEDLQNAWKHPVGVGSALGVASGVGQQGARGAGKKDLVPDAPKASGNDAMPVDDIETAYRLYAEEISTAWKTPR